MGEEKVHIISIHITTWKTWEGKTPEKGKIFRVVGSCKYRWEHLPHMHFFLSQ